MIKDFLPKSLAFSKLSKKERSLFYVVLALLAIFLMERFVLRNVFTQLTYLNNRIARLQLNYQKAKSLIANKEEIINTIEKYKNYLEAKSSEGEDSLSQILSLLEAVARKNNIALSDIKPSQSIKQTKNSLVYTVDLGLQGSPEKIMHFIADLQKAECLFEIERANLIPLEDSLQLKMTLLTVIFK
jgi:hypothetical protein